MTIKNQTTCFSILLGFEDVPLVEFMYLAFIRMLGERYRRPLESLFLYCYVFRALINSLVCWFWLDFEKSNRTVNLIILKVAFWGFLSKLRKMKPEFKICVRLLKQIQIIETHSSFHRTLKVYYKLDVCLFPLFRLSIIFPVSVIILLALFCLLVFFSIYLLWLCHFLLLYY